MNVVQQLVFLRHLHWGARHWVPASSRLWKSDYVSDAGSAACDGYQSINSCVTIKPLELIIYISERKFGFCTKCNSCVRRTAAVQGFQHVVQRVWCNFQQVAQHAALHFRIVDSHRATTNFPPIQYQVVVLTSDL